MSLISDREKNKKLDQYNINILTKYIVDNNILVRNSNDSYNDDINKGIICEKQYYLNNKLVLTENKFDSRIEYTFISNKQDNTDYTCLNCGYKAKLKEFTDGCPFCRTRYNIDYTDKDMGSKYHYDRVLRNTTYRIITALVDLIISIILSFLFIKYTSRTFNSVDIIKVFIYGFIMSLILYYFFYILDAYIILSPIKKYKDKQNQKQIDFWKRTQIDQKTFYNNLNYELRKKYYGSSNIIDYDVIDYDEFNDYEKNNMLYVDIKLYVRVILIKNGKLITKYINDICTLKRLNVEAYQLKEGSNLVKCLNCGSAIDLTKGYCDYCHAKINYLQEWIMETGEINNENNL